MVITSNIKQRCERSGISVYALEKTLGFGNSTISKWDTSSPTIDKLTKVADYFDCTIDELLREAETQTEG